MELISDEKNRYRTFMKRNKGLTKKAYELKTLCSVDVCFIVYGPKLDESPSDQEEIWPLNHDEIQALIDSYRKQSAEDRKRRTNDLTNFFEDRNKKAEETLTKLRKKNDEAKYPTWNDRYNDFSVEELRQFGAVLENKLQEVKTRVAAIRGSSAIAKNQANLLQDYRFDDMTSIHHHPMYNLQAAAGKGISLHQLHSNNYKSMVNPAMMMLMNENHNHFTSSSSSSSIHHHDHLLLGGASGSCNFPVERAPVCYDQAAAMGYYSFSMSAEAMVPYVQLPMIAGSPNSQVHALHHGIDDYYEVSEFHVKNQN
ncbi:agamous-like MADS-box protein AGL80 [Diospyros lotus]|uniref:agamous-like MADS-box protein AGL80 n=1 Tax=Diospyros lotus TaxID=55363 RepID=UPI002252B8E4|nr:agamous-like MADS-box protein AGL80 [Diospyros lotus]